MKATSPSLGGAGLHVTTTLTKLEELPVQEPVEPVKPVLSILADPELTELEEVSSCHEVLVHGSLLSSRYSVSKF